ncbi:MAG TPA: SUMF1/EgtB/PvdO family nonheme iron enzyme [Polyangiaceae bacterium]
MIGRAIFVGCTALCACSTPTPPTSPGRPAAAAGSSGAATDAGAAGAADAGGGSGSGGIAASGGTNDAGMSNAGSGAADGGVTDAGSGGGAADAGPGPDTCGDGLVAPSEECDDGNTAAGDGCSGVCQLETGWSCAGSPSVCSRSCTGLLPTCGAMGSSSCCDSSIIPGGTYLRTNDTAFPARVSPFRLDLYEPSVGRFRGFVSAYAGGWRPGASSGRNSHDPSDSGWDASWTTLLPADLVAAVQCNAGFQTWTDSPGSNESRPINCTNWYESLAFCIWDGGRLPTEAEWNDAAAAGSEQRVYPWSNPPSSTTINGTFASYACTGDGSASGNCAFTDILNVGSRPNGNGKWGQADLAGSEAEWTLDYWGALPVPCTDCANHTTANTHVMRGKSFYDPAADLTTAVRDMYVSTDRNNAIGFRCARDN